MTEPQLSSSGFNPRAGLRDRSPSEPTPEPPFFRFTHDSGSALLYYGDEFCGKFSEPARMALTAILVANKLMREEVDGFTKHVGGETFQESVEVLFRTKRQDEDTIEGMVRTSKGLGKLAQERLDLLETAWGIIANCGGGDWSKETLEWQEAAVKWRDEYLGRKNSTA